MLSGLVVSLNKHCQNNALEYLECWFRHCLQREGLADVPEVHDPSAW
jgi:hypothetical protein